MGERRRLDLTRILRDQFDQRRLPLVIQQGKVRPRQRSRRQIDSGNGRKRLTLHAFAPRMGILHIEDRVVF